MGKAVKVRVGIGVRVGVAVRGMVQVRVRIRRTGRKEKRKRKRSEKRQTVFIQFKIGKTKEKIKKLLVRNVFLCCKVLHWLERKNFQATTHTLITQSKVYSQESEQVSE